jgi:hypothetical protein
MSGHQVLRALNDYNDVPTLGNVPKRVGNFTVIASEKPLPAYRGQTNHWEGVALFKDMTTEDNGEQEFLPWSFVNHRIKEETRGKVVGLDDTSTVRNTAALSTFLGTLRANPRPFRMKYRYDYNGYLDPFRDTRYYTSEKRKAEERKYQPCDVLRRWPFHTWNNTHLTAYPAPGALITHMTDGEIQCVNYWLACEAKKHNCRERFIADSILGASLVIQFDEKRGQFYYQYYPTLLNDIPESLEVENHTYVNHDQVFTPMLRLRTDCAIDTDKPQFERHVLSEDASGTSYILDETRPGERLSALVKMSLSF